MTNKTVATNASVEDFINGLDDTAQQADSRQLLQIFQRVTKEKPVMWGTAIIGFGSVSLTYTSGRQVDWMQIGFSPRKGKLTLYLTFDAAKLTSQFPNLGKYTIGKGCVYIKRLADVNLDELTKLITAGWQSGYQNPDRPDGKEQIISSN